LEEDQTTQLDVLGMTNQFDTGDRCRTNNTAARNQYYCFNSGVFAGLTPMAMSVGGLIVVPFMVAAAVTIIEHGRIASEKDTLLDGQEPLVNRVDVASREQRESLETTIKWAWVCGTMLWLAVPLGAFLTSSFYTTSVAGIILAFSLSAALPLSWHLAFVALPSVGFLGTLIGLGRGSMSNVHQWIAWSTVLMAAIHGGGEIIYLILTGTFLSSMSISGDNENIIMILGLALVCIVFTIAAVAKFRSLFRSWFLTMHRTLAFSLLLVATSHFWAFSFFLVPAVAFHAVAAATLVMGATKSLASPSPFPDHVMASAMALSFAINVIVLLAVWTGRAHYMIQPSAGLQLPFLFPALTVGVGFLGSFTVSIVALTLWRRYSSDPSTNM
jgi:hypothetical protein